MSGTVAVAMELSEECLMERKRMTLVVDRVTVIGPIAPQQSESRSTRYLGGHEPTSGVDSMRRVHHVAVVMRRNHRCDHDAKCHLAPLLLPTRLHILLLWRTMLLQHRPLMGPFPKQNRRCYAFLLNVLFLRAVEG